MDSGLLTAYSYGLYFVYLHVCVLISSFYKDSGHIGLGPHPKGLDFNLIFSLKALSLNKSHSEMRGARL